MKNNFIIFILLDSFLLYMDSLNVLIVFPFIIESFVRVCIYSS